LPVVERVRVEDEICFFTLRRGLPLPLLEGLFLAEGLEVVEVDIVQVYRRLVLGLLKDFSSLLSYLFPGE